jgi:hypothetical protein
MNHRCLTTGWVVLVGLSSLAGCRVSPARTVCTSVAAPGPLVSNAALFRLDIYDARAVCAGSALAPGAGAPLMSHTYGKGEHIVLDVPPGPHAIVLTAFADAAATMGLGEACVAANLAPGAQLCWNLTLAPLPDLAGAPSDLAAAPSDLAAASPDLAGAPADMMATSACAVSGHAGGALRFSFVDDSYVDLGSTLAIPTDFTVEAWINPANTTGDQTIFSKDVPFMGPNQFRFVLSGSNLVFYMTDASGNDYGLGALTSSSTIATNKWSHVALTKGGNVFTMYVNGAPVAINTTTQALVHSGTMSARIGARNCCSDDVIDGVIDEVRLWNVARSRAAILCGMQGEISPADPDYAHLVDYWTFDEASGNIAKDLIGGHDGTLVNAPARVTSTAF